MLRQLVSAIIILSLLVQGSGRLFILINFKIHQAYIAHFLCENRNNPQVKCDGMCHLKKELRKDDEQKREQQPPEIQLRDQQLFLPESGDKLCDRLKFFTRQNTAFPFNCGIPGAGFVPNLFHPPDQSMV